MNTATPARLQEMIGILTSRAKELEVALQEAQLLISGEIHPLLVQTEQSSDHTSVLEGAPSELGEDEDDSSNETNSIQDLSYALGTLSITGERVSRVCVNIVVKLPSHLPSGMAKRRHRNTSSR